MGEKYQFGDLLNGYLVKQATTVNYRLFGMLAGTAVQMGVKYEELPDAIPMFSHACETIGTPKYGILHPPKPLSPAVYAARGRSSSSGRSEVHFRAHQRAAHQLIRRKGAT